jgi:hypothetical protein
MARETEHSFAELAGTFKNFLVEEIDFRGIFKRAMIYLLKYSNMNQFANQTHQNLELV